MTKDLKIVLVQNVLNAIASGFFLYGFFAENHLLTTIGGIGMILFLFTLFGEVLNPLAPIILSLILSFIFNPWYYGVFWATGVFTIFQIPSFLFVVISKRKYIQEMEKSFQVHSKYGDQKYKDIIYSKVDINCKDKYQQCFEQILSVIDVNNETIRTKGLHNRKKSKIDWEKQLEIISEFEISTGLEGIVVQTMTEQYFWADEIQREMDKKIWIERVLNREDTDWFPDSNFIYFEVMGGKKI